MVKKRKNIALITSIFLVLMFVIVLIIYFNKDDTKLENLSHEDTVRNVITNVFLDDNTTQDKIEEYTESPVISMFISLGEDSYARIKPSTNLNLATYEKAQEKYADIVEKKYLEGTSYTIEELEDGTLTFEIKPWYYATYTSDVSALTNMLMELEGVDEQLFDEDFEEYSNYLYKAQVKAMSIINNYLDYYDNKDEIRYFTFDYIDDEPDENQYLSLYFNLVGVTSDYMVDDEETALEQSERLESYLETAIKGGTVSVDNPLEL